VQSVDNAAGWCRKVGVSQLTVYEEHGLLSEYDHEIRCQLLRSNKQSSIETDFSASEVDYQPLTPPPSEGSESRPISPFPSSRTVIPSIKIVLSDRDTPSEKPRRRSVSKRRTLEKHHASKNTFTVNLISSDASKDAIAAAATTLAQARSISRSKKEDPFTITVPELNAILEGDHGLSAPDFMILHAFDPRTSQRKVPLELYNFPPWQIRLTEIHHSRFAHVRTPISPLSLTLPFTLKYQSTPTAYPLDEVIFREAFDEYAGAEFRFGK